MSLALLRSNLQQLLAQAQKLLTFRNITYCLVGLASLRISQAFLRHIRVKARENYYTRQAQAYRLVRDQYILSLNIPEVSHIPIDLYEQVLNSDVQGLKNLLQEGKITSEEMLNIFMKRVQTVGLEYEAITKSNYKAALIRARELDALRKSHPEQCTGELFGVVISVKDLIDVKDQESTIGFASRLSYIPKQDGLCAQILQRSGAIIFVKSNVAQGALTYDSVNFIFGQTKNAWNKLRSAGGSSGGEGALIALRCSPLGLGSDLGGSIRVPSSFNGIVGLKPCCFRLTQKGFTKFSDVSDGQICVLSTIGPHGKTVEDCALLMRAMLNHKYYDEVPQQVKDPYYQPHPFNEELYTTNKKLRIGYYKSIAFLPATDCMQRAVEIARVQLQKRGHELIEIELPRIEELVSSLFQCYFGDGAQGLIKMLDGERHIDCYKQTMKSVGKSNRQKKAMVWLLQKQEETRTALLVKSTYEYSVVEERINNSKIQHLREFYYKFWTDLNLDAVICPPFGCPASDPKFTEPLMMFGLYAMIYNMLNYAAGVVPVTIVREDEQNYTNNSYNDSLKNFMNENMKGSVGLPVSVQIVTLPFQEELCLNVMRQLQDEVQFLKQHPYPV